MIGLVVRFELRDAAAAGRFDELTSEVVEAIRLEEPGTVVYSTHAVPGEPLARIFYEVYADQPAFQAPRGGAARGRLPLPQGPSAPW